MDVVFVSYETLRPPEGVTAFINARRKGPEAVREEIEKNVSSSRRELLSTNKPSTNFSLTLPF